MMTGELSPRIASPDSRASAGTNQEDPAPLTAFAYCEKK
jgi:hypothetical protein